MGGKKVRAETSTPSLAAQTAPSLASTRPIARPARSIKRSPRTSAAQASQCSNAGHNSSQPNADSHTATPRGVKFVSTVPKYVMAMSCTKDKKCAAKSNAALFLHDTTRYEGSPNREFQKLFVEFRIGGTKNDPFDDAPSNPSVEPTAASRTKAARVCRSDVRTPTPHRAVLAVREWVRMPVHAVGPVRGICYAEDELSRRPSTSGGHAAWVLDTRREIPRSRPNGDTSGRRLS